MPTTLVILIVEDDAILRNILEQGLGDAGFELVIACDGADAFAQLDKDATLINAVVTDIRLGDGPSGWDVGRHARELVPHMPIIYMSGDSATDWSAMGVPDSVMIQKPFVIAQIVTAIAALLNKDAV